MDKTPRHQCLVYSGDPSRQLASLAASIHAHLKANYRCLYLNSPTMNDGIRSYLIASGLNVFEEIHKRRLILSSDRSHLRDGVFDPQLMMEKLSAVLNTALEDGYEGLWASGDMTWEFGETRDFSRLLDYERALDAFFASHPALRGVCQYHVDLLPKGVVETGVVAHPAIYVNETLSKTNSQYLPVKC
jgi:hypothetical protein